jgi:hypothetical protein
MEQTRTKCSKTLKATKLMDEQPMGIKSIFIKEY